MENNSDKLDMKERQQKDMQESSEFLPLDFEADPGMRDNPRPETEPQPASQPEAKAEESQQPEPAIVPVRKADAPAATTVAPPPLQPEPPEENPPKRKKPHLDPIEGFGEEFRDGRESKGLSLKEVEEITKIRVDYIQALEDEDFDRLPPSVYVYAYARSLTSLYGIHGTRKEEIMTELKGHLNTGHREAVFSKIKVDHEADPEGEQKLKHLLLFFGVIAVLIATGLAVTFYFVVIHSPDQAPAPDTTPETAPPVISSKFEFDSSRLERLNPPQFIKMSELPTER